MPTIVHCTLVDAHVHTPRDVYYDLHMFCDLQAVGEAYSMSMEVATPSTTSQVI